MTTMWNLLPSKEVGEEREKNLCLRFWKPFVDRGAQVVRLDNNPESAWKIVEQFISIQENDDVLPLSEGDKDISRVSFIEDDDVSHLTGDHRVIL